MPKYRFAVRSKEGKLRTGSVTEASVEAARERLKGAGFVIVSLTEEVELVVHQARTPTGVQAPKLERAAIIEFEMSLGERIVAFLNRFVFRKEFAGLVFVVGMALALYINLKRPKPVQAVEPKYQALEVQVQVDPGGLSGETYVAVLPDIPLRFTQAAAEGDLMKYSFEALKQPGRVEVSLLDGTGEVVGQGEGLLSLRAEGSLAAAVPLAAPKKKP